MKIGLFSDTFRPSINGIVFVIESTKRHLESLGHEVYIICPGKPLRPGARADQAGVDIDEDHILRFRSFKGLFYDDYDTSLFFPPAAVAKIKDLQLDIVHVFTPGQIGLLGLYIAFKYGTPVVAQHSTDVYEYAEHYPATLPGILAMVAILPFSLKIRGKDARDLLKLYRPRRNRVEWAHEAIEKALTLIYSRCDIVIVLSRKSAYQLQEWQKANESEYEIALLPNGVDALPVPTRQTLNTFCHSWNIEPDDEVITFVGRLGEEKNLDLLIPVLEKVVQKRPNAKLLFVGDFEYRETLEKQARESHVGSKVLFTGIMPREELGVAYAASSVFVFPSLKDTQGWVLHEAAHAGLPIVMIDRDLTEVVKDGVNGYFVKNTVDDFADKVIRVLSDKNKYRELSRNSVQLASQFSERCSAQSLSDIYKRISRSGGSSPHKIIDD